MSPRMMAALLILSALGHMAGLLMLAWMQDRLEAAHQEHERIRKMLDEAREFARDCMAQSKRMADVAVHGPRIKGA
jgi:hypothetical protein